MKDIRVVKINTGASTAAQTELRGESARLWNRLVKLHKFCRKKRWNWLKQSDLEKHLKGRFNLHSASVQALIQKFCANIDSTRTKRKNGDSSARYPWRDQKKFQIVMWKASAIKRNGNRLILSNGRDNAALKVKIPTNLPLGKIVAAELGFREIRLTISNEVDKPISAGQNVVAADMGVIHLAVMTDGVTSKAIVGRGLRSITQGRNRALAIYSELLSKTTKGSRRNRKLRIAKARMLDKYHKRAHNLLHHAANQMIDFCVENEAGTLVVGDIAEMSRNARKKKKGSRRTNQMNSGNPLGILYNYLEYKGKLKGVSLKKENEAYTSQTCPVCGHRHKPTGRIYKCRSCDYVGVRDNVGATNFLNKHHHDGIIKVNTLLPPSIVKYLRPVALRQPVVDRLNGGKLLDTTLLSALGTSVSGSSEPSSLTIAA
ncbi:MAG: RNA-guided endonuclease InsQ/TnpB family protein [Vibrio toranzoniae]|uniref:RNA-guided endonuclease InsQ/TnpB family protein n=1 Tax=Vibrio toranzoniae TaxID=1194427 RepID=UPI001376B019|nr:transposase [Vibrio toranzoniae]